MKDRSMRKKIILALALIFAFSSIDVYAKSVDNLEPIGKSNSKTTTRKNARPSASASDASKNKTTVNLDKDTVYYPNANIKSAVAKYKAGNYTGCLQELFSLTKKDPSNALAYYYMAMAYTHVDMQSEAIQAYEKVMALSPNTYLSDNALKGRDCLTGGPACKSSSGEEQTELDMFVNSPYGSGLSSQLEQEVKQKQLINIKETINKKDELEHRDIQKIKNFDEKNKSSIEQNDRIAQVSDEEILQAIKTLKDAGLTLNVQPNNVYAQMSQYQDPKMAEMSLLLGNNNNNNGNSMMNMLPMLMSQAQKGENIDPRIMQAMMMNSMMSDFGYLNNNNNNNY